MIITITDQYIRLGNLCFLFAYYLKKYKNIDCIYHNNLYLSNYHQFLTIKCVYDQNITYQNYSDDFFNEFLNLDNCDFEKFKSIINWDLFKNVNYVPTNKYIAINCRYGDYLTQRNIELGYKSFNPKIYSKIFDKYSTYFDQFNTIVVISDDIELAKKENDQILKSLNKQIIYSNTNNLDDLNLLINANIIIGSCSTFSFLGFALNKYQSKMYVEYPYYHEYTGYQQLDGLYNDKNIIKITNIK